MLTLLMQIDAFDVMKKGKSDALEFGNFQCKLMAVEVLTGEMRNLKIYKALFEVFDCLKL